MDIDDDDDDDVDDPKTVLSIEGGEPSTYLEAMASWRSRSGLPP